VSVEDALRRIDAGIGDAGLPPGAARQRGQEPLEMVQDLVEVHIPRGGRAVVVSDLHLTGTVTEASKRCTEELISVLEGWTEPGAFVINGDGFEQLHEPVSRIDEILDAHQVWTDALQRFSEQPGHSVVVLSGNHDGNIAWDPEVAMAMRRRLGAQHIAIAADLVFANDDGPQRVHVVHGNQDDEYNAFADPRSPLDTPTGHHIVRQVLPQVEGAAKPGGLLEGLYGLAEPTTAGEMVGSRLLYRGIGRKGWLLFVPFVAALALKLARYLPGLDDDELRSNMVGWMFGFGVSVLGVLMLVVIVTVLTLLGVHHALSTTEVGQRSGIGAHNAATREHAARVIELGYAGMIAGHTHTPELTVVGDGFYANSGCGVEVLGPRRTYFGLPRPFTGVRRVSRVELHAGDELEVRLVIGDQPAPVAGLIERLVIRPDRDTPTEPTVVASLPTGATWPVDPSTLGTFARMRRARRVAGTLLAAVAIINVVTAVLGTELRSFAIFSSRIPEELPIATGVLIILISSALLGLARGIRRGYLQTWVAAVSLLVLNALALFLKGVYYEEALLNLALAVWLLIERRHFRVLVSGKRKRLLWVVSATIGAIGLATALAIIFDEELATNIGRLGLTIVIGLGIVVGSMARRPGAHRKRTGEERARAEHDAREILHRFGGDTLDHSAVRDDKALLFTSGGVVSYDVIDGRMVVSPDPICGVEDRNEVWASTMDYADTHGYSIAVLAASATWLPIYHASGLHDVYLGDEAIVDCGRFVADRRGPTAAAADVARERGYTVSIHDVRAIDGPTRTRLESLAVGAEIGAPGSSFATSMGRVAGPEDHALLALCRDADGEVAAFDQFVPASNIKGYTLDLACTAPLGADAEAVGHLLLVEAIEWLYDHDAQSLSLGLAASGGTNYGAARGGKLPLERRVLAQFADHSELDRRRGVDAMYGPVWRPRYVVMDAMRRRKATAG
jgi:lysylphosphatidylglycerol synthetase-like protein (DUF2156 family)/UDP-2,3-diacylglucosamine pyrophosphatase LpxH